MLATVYRCRRLDRRGRRGLTPGEEASYATAKVDQSPGDNRTDALEDEQPGAWIDVSVGLALKRETECDKKHQCDREVF